jgi:membrane protein
MKTLIIFGQRLGAMWGKNDLGGLGASLAYFALFSLFPLLLITLSVVGAVIDPQSFDVQNWLLNVIDSPEIRDLIDGTLGNLRDSRGQAGLVGFATLLFAASGIFGALDRAMNAVWNVAQPEERTLLQTVRVILVDKLLSFLMVLGCALLLLLSIISTIVITTVSNYVPRFEGIGLLLQTAQFLVAFTLLMLGLSMLFKALPDTKVPWRAAIFGGAIAALLLTLLQKGIGIYLSQADYGSYGVVGGFMALMVYFYLTSQIMLLGGACAAVYAGLRKPTTSP